MPRLISFDPGKVTGVAHGYFDDATAYQLTCSEVVPGGSKGFSDWMWEYSHFDDDDIVVSEKFELNLGNQFKADLTPVQIEGILYHYTDVIWQTRAEKGKAGMMDRILKQHGLWNTGADVGWEDGRDINDAIIHALVYLRKQKHLPTLKAFWA